MLTKGIIKKIDYNSNTCIIRIPLLESASETNEVSTSGIFAIQPGTCNSYKENDVVIIAFENNEFDRPVIIGKLFQGTAQELTEARGTVNTTNLKVTDSATIPLTTKLTYDGLATSENYINVDKGFTTYKSLLDIVKVLKDQEGDLNKQSIQLEGKVSSTQNARTTGFGWTIDDKSWRIQSYDDSHAGLDTIDIFKVDNSGITVTGDIKIVGYPRKLEILYGQNADRVNPPEVWQTEVPPWEEGKVVWQKTITYTYEYNESTGNIDEVINTSIICLTGQDGADGRPGDPAISYWLDVNMPVHTGSKQTEPIVIRALKQLGNDTENMSVDTTATISYKWGEDGEFTNVVGLGTVTINPTTTDENDEEIQNILDDNLIIVAKHGDVVFETETVTFSPLNTPVLDLTNDSASMAYYNDTPINASATVTSTAALYLNGSEIDEAEVQYVWTLENCTGYGLGKNDQNETIHVEPVNHRCTSKVIVITGLNYVNATATCTASYDDELYTKVFSISKQLKGDGAVNYWIETSTPIHTGSTQSEPLIIKPLIRTGGDNEDVDYNATIIYKWGEDGTEVSWTPNEANNITEITLTNLEDKNLIIIAKHGEAEFDRETITFSPLNTPVIDLDNDSDFIPYHVYGEKINANSVVYSEAALWLNGHKVPNLTYIWTLENCSGVAVDPDTDAELALVNNKIQGAKLKVSSLSENAARAVVSVEYENEVYEKVFSITKQLAACSYWLEYSSPIHMGINQEQALSLRAMRQSGQKPAELDPDAKVLYRWANSNTWYFGNGTSFSAWQTADLTNTSLNTANIPVNNFRNNDLIIKSVHLSEVDGVITETAYDNETITYTPLGVYILDLSNDNANLVYDSDGNVGSPITTTATLYFNGNPVTLDSNLSYSWTYTNADLTCQVSGDNNKIFTVSALNVLNTSVVCSIEYQGVTYTKVLSIAKQQQGRDGRPGRDGESATTYWLDVPVDVHRGIEQSQDIIITAYKKVGVTGSEEVDSAAHLYINGSNTEFPYAKDEEDTDIPGIWNISANTIKTSYARQNLSLEIKHGATTYDTEIIEYSPNTPIISLSQDAGQINYNKDGTKTTTYTVAKLYLNGQDISAKATSFSWNIPTGATATATGKVLNVTDIETSPTIFTCTFLYNTVNYQKDFVVTRTTDGKDGKDAVNYWIDVPTDIHLGINQTQNITVIAYKKVGDEEEEIDEDAIFFINNVQKTSSTPGTYTIPATLIRKSPIVPAGAPADYEAGFATTDITIKISHGALADAYDTEIINYSPGTPILILTNDSGEIHQNKSGTITTTSTTAKLYVGAAEATEDLTITWYTLDSVTSTLNAITAENTLASVSGNTLTVSDVLNSPTTFVAIATYAGKTYTKNFNVLKTADGQDGRDGTDGISPDPHYIHFVYCDDPEGSTAAEINYSTTETRDYIGVYTDTTEADIISFDDLPSTIVWSKVIGADGIDGVSTYNIHIVNDTDYIPSTYTGVTQYTPWPAEKEAGETDEEFALRRLTNDWYTKTLHEVTANYGLDQVTFTVSNSIPTNPNGGLVLYYEPVDVFHNSIQDTSTPVSSYSAFITGLTSQNVDEGEITYKLYSGTTIVASTKFKVVKSKHGREGQDATDYWVTLSENSLKLNKEGTISPTQITATFYKQTGTQDPTTVTNANYYVYAINGSRNNLLQADVNGTALIDTSLNSVLSNGFIIEFVLPIDEDDNGSYDRYVVVDSETVHTIVDGSDGKSVVIKASMSNCTEIGDAFISDGTESVTLPDNTTVTATAGNIYIVVSKTPNGSSGYDYIFTDGGQFRGNDGISISDVHEYYLATDQATGITINTSGWTTNVSADAATLSASKPYLWNYEEIIYSDDTLGHPHKTTTSPSIIGNWSRDGRGISSITEHYAVNNDKDTAPISGWTTTIQTVSNTNKYLWNYETINYDDSTSSSTDPIIIGTYGEQGPAGAPGTPGAPGAPGTPGESAYTVSIINDFVSIYCDGSGNPTYSSQDWVDSTTHTIKIFKGSIEQAFKVKQSSDFTASSNTGLTVVLTATNIIDPATSASAYVTSYDLNSSPTTSSYAAYITNLGNGLAGKVIYNLYKDTELIASAKFEAVKLIPGEAATIYWLTSNTPVHLGVNQTKTITINAKVKTGEGVEADDTSTYFRYKWGNGAWSSWTQATVLEFNPNDSSNEAKKFRGEDLTVQAAHYINNDYEVYETEIITYSSNTSPTLDLSNDSDALVYKADGTTKLVNTDEVSTTATVYLGETDYSEGVTFDWTAVGCTYQVVSGTNNRTIKVTGINNNVKNAKVICIATMNGGSNSLARPPLYKKNKFTLVNDGGSSVPDPDIFITLRKEFSITKQIKGADGASYWLKLSSPIHLGYNQKGAIVVTPMWKEDEEHAESTDLSASLKYKWGEDGTWSSSWSNTITIQAEDCINKDLIIKATHDTSANPEEIYETETITYSSTTDPSLDLDNDSDAIAYLATGSKLDETATVSSTASVYLGEAEYSLGTQFSWAVPDGYVLDTDYALSSNNRTITIINLQNDSDRFICTARFVGKPNAAGTKFDLLPLYKTLNSAEQIGLKRADLANPGRTVPTAAIYITKSKTFTVAKQIKGDTGADSVRYWIELSDSVFTEKATNAAGTNQHEISPANITASFLMQQGSGQIVNISSGAQYRRNGGSWINVPGSSITLTPSNRDSNNKIVLELRLTNNSNTIVDRATITTAADAVYPIATRDLYVLVPNAASANNIVKPTRDTINRVNNYSFAYPAGTSNIYTWAEGGTAATIDYRWWLCTETEFSDETFEWTTPVQATALNSVIAVAQGKTTNYYSDYAPSGNNIKEGDCWFDTAYTAIETPATADGYIGKYIKVQDNEGTHVVHSGQNPTRLVPYTQGNSAARYNVVPVTNANYNSLNITPGTTEAYETHILKQWNGTAWEPISDEIVKNKVTANYINALDITARKITILQNPNDAQSNNNPILFQANGLSSTGEVQIGGFKVNANSLFTNTLSAPATLAADNSRADNGLWLSSNGVTSTNSIAGSTNNPSWVIAAGDDFGVTSDGKLYANNASLTGTVQATVFKIYSSNSTPLQIESKYVPNAQSTNPIHINLSQEVTFAKTDGGFTPIDEHGSGGLIIEHPVNNNSFTTYVDLIIQLSAETTFPLGIKLHWTCDFETYGVSQNITETKGGYVYLERGILNYSTYERVYEGGKTAFGQWLTNTFKIDRIENYESNNTASIVNCSYQGREISATYNTSIVEINPAFSYPGSNPMDISITTNNNEAGFGFHGNLEPETRPGYTIGKYSLGTSTNYWNEGFISSIKSNSIFTNNLVVNGAIRASSSIAGNNVLLGSRPVMALDDTYSPCRCYVKYGITKSLGTDRWTKIDLSSSALAVEHIVCAVATPTFSTQDWNGNGVSWTGGTGTEWSGTTDNPNNKRGNLLNGNHTAAVYIDNENDAVYIGADEDACAIMYFIVYTSYITH